MNLSLYHIDQTLQQLLDYRAERMADTEQPPDAEETAALEGEIRKYLEQLPAKVDGVAAILRMFKGRHEAIRAEIGRLKLLDDAVQSDEARLKGYVAEILERQPKPAKGSRKLCGATSELRLVGNGGLQSLTVNEDLLDDEYRDATVRMPLRMWRALQYDMAVDDMPDKSDALTITPSNARIRAALAENCPLCGGLGTKSPSGPSDAPMEECPACGGTGKQGVPGAHLEPRGAHVEVR